MHVPEPLGLPRPEHTQFCHGSDSPALDIYHQVSILQLRPAYLFYYDALWSNEVIYDKIERKRFDEYDEEATNAREHL